MKKPAITDETRIAILRAAWSLIAKKKRLDVSQAEIAATAGVSRQTVYLAFGDRAGLLTAMTHQKDADTDHVARLAAIGDAGSHTPEEFLRFVGVWIDYLPHIYPVGILLDASSLTDPSARAAWDDRMKTALLAGMKRILRHLARDRRLAPEWNADRAAEFAWSLVHPTAWRLLVVDCGWSEEEFRDSRLAMIESLIVPDRSRKAASGDAARRKS